MKTNLLFLSVLLMFVSCQPTPKVAENPRDGVFIHISSGPENPHKILMPLKMAEIMALDKDVLIYFDIKGVNTVLKDALDICQNGFTSSKEELKILIDKGVIIMVCPTCLKMAGKTPDDIMPGVLIANKEKFFSFTKGRILTLDY